MTEFFQSLGMNYEWAWFVATIAGILLIALPLMLSVAMIIYVDRKVWAAINLRRGPNVVGPFGLLQSFADGLKVFLQETIIPSAANKGIFLLAPLFLSVPPQYSPISISGCCTFSRSVHCRCTAW